MELAAVMWPTKMGYESTSIAMGIPNAPAPAELWSAETTDDSSSTRMETLDHLVEVAAP